MTPEMMTASAQVGFTTTAFFFAIRMIANQVRLNREHAKEQNERFTKQAEVEHLRITANIEAQHERVLGLLDGEREELKRVRAEAAQEAIGLRAELQILRAEAAKEIGAARADADRYRLELQAAQERSSIKLEESHQREHQVRKDAEDHQRALREQEARHHERDREFRQEQDKRVQTLGPTLSKLVILLEARGSALADPEDPHRAGDRSAGERTGAGLVLIETPGGKKNPEGTG